MRATIVKFVETQVGRKKTPATKMIYRTEDGDEREYNILKFNKDQLAMISDMNPGDQVDISWKKSDKGFWDLVGMVHTDFPQKSDTESTVEAGPSTTQVSSGKATRNWRPDPNKDRGVALRYAIDTMPQLFSADRLAAMDYEEYAEAAFSMAELFVNYITGERKVENTDADIPEPVVDSDIPH